MAEPPSRGRRAFAPVVLAGLASAGLCAVAGNRPWVRGDLPAPEGEGATGYTAALALDLTADMPLASALSLLLLAGWGVLLVSRGVVRRLMALVALLAATGLLATVVVGARTLPATVRDAVAEVGGSAAVDTRFTGWYAAAVAGAVVSVGAAALALRLLRHWPEMGSRYDAPGVAAAASVPPSATQPSATQPSATGPSTTRPSGRTSSTQAGVDDADAGNLELWKAIDEGRDPTA